MSCKLTKLKLCTQMTTLKPILNISNPAVFDSILIACEPAVIRKLQVCCHLGPTNVLRSQNTRLLRRRLVVGDRRLASVGAARVSGQRQHLQGLGGSDVPSWFSSSTAVYKPLYNCSVALFEILPKQLQVMRYLLN